jgi:hypothetical protein
MGHCDLGYIMTEFYFIFQNSARELQFNVNFLCDQKVDVYQYVPLYIYWNENEKNGFNNGKTFRVKMLDLKFELNN